MNGPASARRPLPFTLHLVGATLFALIVLGLLYQTFFTPVDLFIHHAYLSQERLRFGIYGFVFFGFSLTLLRFCKVSTFWGALYAVGSWVLFIIAFYPALPFGSSGMMRRVANVGEYEEALRSIAQTLQTIRLAAVLGFGVVQVLFVRLAYQQLHSRACHELKNGCSF